MGQMDQYENDFEAALLKDTSAYYSRKASNWIEDDSCPDYMLKVVITDNYSLVSSSTIVQYHMASISYCVFHCRLRSA